MTTPRVFPAGDAALLESWRRALAEWLGSGSPLDAPSDAHRFLRELWGAMGAVLAEPDAVDAPPALQELKREAMETLVDEGWVPCHAAVFGDGRVALAPGASGSGKSTLSVILAREGYAVSDELVFMREQAGMVVAATAPLPLSVSAETLKRFPFTKAWRLDPRRQVTGDEKAFLLPPRAVAGTREVAAVVVMRREQARRAASLVRVDAREAARGLLESTYRFLGGGRAYADARRRAWRVVTALIDLAPAYVLSGDLLVDASPAVADIGRILERADRVVA